MNLPGAFKIGLDLSVINSTAQAYDKIALRYAHKWFDNPIVALSQVLTLLVPPGGIILDVGCGPGQYLKFFSTHSYTSIGIDLSINMLYQARTLTKINTLARMDLTRLGFINSCFDGIWACGSLCHIPVNISVDVLRNLRSLLKRNGILFIAIQEGNGSMIRKDGRFYQFYTEETFRELLSSAGFSIVLFEKADTNQARPKTWLYFYCRPNWKLNYL